MKPNIATTESWKTWISFKSKTCLNIVKHNGFIFKPNTQEKQKKIKWIFLLFGFDFQLQ